MKSTYLELERVGSNRRREVARWIEQRTGARVHRLRVERVNGKVMIYGRTGSHYVRQLALAAAIEVMEPDEIEVHIEMTKHHD